MTTEAAKSPPKNSAAPTKADPTGDLKLLPTPELEKKLASSPEGSVKPRPTNA